MSPSSAKESVFGQISVQMPVDGRVYDLVVIRKVALPVDAPRLVVISHLTNPIAEDMLDVCIRSVKRFTPEPHELWVVDNNSPRDRLERLLDFRGLNIVLNRTEPLPDEARNSRSPSERDHCQQTWGSYANAVGLELAVRLIDPGTRFLVTLHMDALPCAEGWLTFLRSKVANGVAAAGVRMDRTRTPDGVLHVLGYMVDFQVFRKLSLDFLPDLPGLDVGDRVTIKLREAGLDVFACRNTVWEPDLVETIPVSSPLRNLHVDRSFDDSGNVIFLHLGRGLRRSSGEHRKGIAAADWARVVRSAFLLDNPLPEDFG